MSDAMPTKDTETRQAPDVEGLVEKWFDEASSIVERGDQMSRVVASAVKATKQNCAAELKAALHPSPEDTPEDAA